MTALALHRPEIHYAWCGPSLLITDNRGRIDDRHLTGFFFRETRYLSRLVLEVQGEEPMPGSVATVRPHETEHTFLYPPVETGGGGGSGSGGQNRHRGLVERGLDLDLRYRVRPASLEAVLRLSNRWQEHAEIRIGWRLDADFLGLFQAEGGATGEGPETAVEASGDGPNVVFRSLHEELPLSTLVTLLGADGDTEARDGRLCTTLKLARQEERELRLIVRAVDADRPMDQADEDRRIERLSRYHHDVTRLHCPSETELVTITNESMMELGSMALLDGPEEEWMTPAAGMPLYHGAFGRDALTAGWHAAMLDRGELLRGVLAKLRRLQGEEDDPWRDELPGRLIQQARRDPRSRMGETPFGRYYADFASPLMFIISVGQLYGWSGDRRDIEENWDAARRILDWARTHGDRDGDGYLEYETRSPQGPRHQGWKDSDNAVVDENGQQVETPVAPCEIQGYYYAALQFMAGLSVVMGEYRDARSLWREAAELKERFNRDFWLDDEGYVAFGLGADKRPLRTLTSNAAQCITAGIVSDENLPRLVDRIFQPDLFSGWGFRTLSTENPAYNPMSYHLGSVWAVENGTIMFGLRRFGFDDEALELARALYDLARAWAGGRIPETIGGYARDERATPGAYPRANVPQAWNRSTFAILTQTILGIRPIAGLNVMGVDPRLPAWLPEITLRDLRVGDTTVSLRFTRDDSGSSSYEVLDKDGSLRILRQPPLQSLDATVWDRFRALVKGAG